MRADPAGHELDEGRAHALLKQACAIAGLDADGARLLRLGSNAVYPPGHTGRGADLAPRTPAWTTARRSVAVARWLESVDYPAVRVIDVDQPISIDGHAVTFWRSVSDDGDQYATVGEFAEVLARLHRLAAPDRRCTSQSWHPSTTRPNGSQATSG